MSPETYSDTFEKKEAVLDLLGGNVEAKAVVESSEFVPTIAGGVATRIRVIQESLDEGETPTWETARMAQAVVDARTLGIPLGREAEQMLESMAEAGDAGLGGHITTQAQMAIETGWPERDPEAISGSRVSRALKVVQNIANARELGLQLGEEDERWIADNIAPEEGYTNGRFRESLVGSLFDGLRALREEKQPGDTTSYPSLMQILNTGHAIDAAGVKLEPYQHEQIQRALGRLPEEVIGEVAEFAAGFIAEGHNSSDTKRTAPEHGLRILASIIRHQEKV